jgi:16S rRNA (uracil1498-N3)-methyltransferase
MDYYYGHAEGDSIILSNEEFNHLKNVKRIKAGDNFLVTDGAGNLFTGIYKGGNSLPGLLKTESFPKKNYNLHIAVAPTKNSERIEWFLEKAVETGIDEITFLQCRHSERKEIKVERLSRVAIAAMKQSKKVFLPQIHGIISFSDFISHSASATKLIFTQAAEDESTLNRNYKTNENLLALIGPEGDFHESELKLASDKGFIATTLGNSRLRTETAALAVCTIFNFMNAQ